MSGQRRVSHVVIHIIARLALAAISSPAFAQSGPALCPANIVSPKGRQVNGPIRIGLPQITFATRDQSIADPYIERMADGKIRIFGTTNGHFLEFDNEAAMLTGQVPRQVAMRFAHPDGTDLNGDEMIWDSLPITCDINGEQRNVILGGAMTPPNGERNARWPHDNSGRRTYPFFQVGHKFVRGDLPVLPDVNPRDWLGHNYGRDFVRDENGRIIRDSESGSKFMIYEKVTRRTETGKLITEIAMRKMKSCPYQIESDETILLPINERQPYPATRRADGGLLIEGPRIVQMKIAEKNFFVLGFSSGDFPTDKYGINIATSERIEGPYIPVLAAKDGQTDLLDLGEVIRDKYQLSWGPARPAFYRDQTGQMWIVFHAVDKARHPGVDFSRWPEDLSPFQRQLYMAPLSTALDEKGRPAFRLQEVRCRNPLPLTEAT